MNYNEHGCPLTSGLVCAVCGRINPPECPLIDGGEMGQIDEDDETAPWADLPP